MRAKKPFLSGFVPIVTALAAIGAIITFICTKPYIPSKQLSFESYVDKVVYLQNKVDSVSLFYKDVSIDNIWKINMRMKNTGKNTVIGIANASDTDNRDIVLDFGPNFKVLNYDIISNECQCIVKNGDGNLAVWFKKWDVKEELHLDILVWDAANTSTEPVITVNDHELVGVKIKQRTVSVNQIIEETNNLEWLYNLKKVVPAWILKVGRVLALIMCCFMVIAPLWYIGSDIVERVRYKRWENEHFEAFHEKVNAMDIEEETKAKLLRKPSQMPKAISELTKIPIPPDVMPFFESILIVLFTTIFLSFPFLLATLFLLYNL